MPNQVVPSHSCQLYYEFINGNFSELNSTCHSGGKRIPFSLKKKVTSWSVPRSGLWSVPRSGLWSFTWFTKLSQRLLLGFCSTSNWKLNLSKRDLNLMWKLWLRLDHNTIIKMSKKSNMSLSRKWNNTVYSIAEFNLFIICFTQLERYS